MKQGSPIHTVGEHANPKKVWLSSPPSTRVRRSRAPTTMAGSSEDRRYTWEKDDGASSDAADLGGPDVVEAQQEFANFLIQLKTEGTLSATSACILAHWATLGGLGGLANKIAFAPGKQSGAY